MIYLASHNPQKRAELARILAAMGVTTAPARARQLPVEGTTSYLANARVKAMAASRQQPGQLVLADDSGLTLAAAPGALGVQTARELAARPAGVGELDQILALVAGQDRHFTLTTVVVLARDGQGLATGRGQLTGTIAERPVAGSGGLARLLVPAGFTQPLVTLPPAAWFQQNPRARAIQQLRQQLEREGLDGNY